MTEPEKQRWKLSRRNNTLLNTGPPRTLRKTFLVDHYQRYDTVPFHKPQNRNWFCGKLVFLRDTLAAYTTLNLHLNSFFNYSWNRLRCRQYVFACTCGCNVIPARELRPLHSAPRNYRTPPALFKIRKVAPIQISFTVHEVLHKTFLDKVWQTRCDWFSPYQDFSKFIWLLFIGRTKKVCVSWQLVLFHVLFQYFICFLRPRGIAAIRSRSELARSTNVFCSIVSYCSKILFISRSLKSQCFPYLHT